MRSLAELLKNHHVPGVRLSEIRRTCAEAAGAITKWSIKSKDVRYKEGVIFFSVPPVVKTELLLRAHDLKHLLNASGIELKEIR